MPAPGRPYTMLEMKMIVEYIVENKAYKDVKARKMWQDFANTGKLNRTWQSLKETFLKRILPDIHNTYYKLTPAQKRSLKEGCDVDARESKNSAKLEMKTPSENSDSTGDPNDNERASCSKTTGKDNPDITSMITSRSRASTDTIVLENNYETAEQILRDLESNDDKENSNDPQSPSKTLRDYIAYSEPLTPMVQEVIDDFATDEDEPQLQIVEDYEPANGNENLVTPVRSKSPSEIRRSERLSPTKPVTSEKRSQQNKNNDEEENRKSRSRSSSISKVKTLKLKKTNKGWEKKANMDQESQSKNESGNDDIEKSVEKSVAEEINKPADKDETNLTDTPLPNNQEQLDKHANGEKSIDNDKLTSIKGSTDEFQESKKKKAAKRPRSASSSSDKRKMRKDTQIEIQEVKDKLHEPLQNDTQAASIVDTQTYDSHPNIVANNTLGHNQIGSFNSHGNQEKLTSEITNPDLNSQICSPNKNTVPETNPCLQSVSLYAEQFCTTTYSDSEHRDEIAKEDASKQTTSTEVQGDDSKKVKDSNNAKNSNDSNNAKNIQEPTNTNHTEHCDNPKLLEKKKNNTTQADSKTADAPLSPKNKDTVGKTASPFTQDIVVLKSNSESDKSESPHCQDDPKKVVRGNKARDDALANIFGFASGAVTLTTVSKKGGKVNVNPKYRHSCKRRTTSKNGSFRQQINSVSSSSDTESEDMSHFSNYIPPKPYNILSHAGAKFITDGNKLYPLVISKNAKLYHAVGSDGESSEEDDSYWKAKYLEEKKRADELSGLLKRANESEAGPSRSVSKSKSPMMPEKSAKRRRVNKKDETIDISSDTSNFSKTSKQSEKTVKIKFNDKKEIELECGWSQVSTVLDKMASMFQKTDVAKPSANTLQVDQKKPRTPTPEISEKVNRIESEIFKEIAERDKIEKSRENNVVDITKDKEEIAGSGKTSDDNVSNSGKASDENVTMRKRGRPKKTPVTSSESAQLSISGQMPTSQNKANSPNPDTPSPVLKNNVKAAVKRLTRPVKKLSGAETLSMDTRRSRSKLSSTSRGGVEIPNDDPNVKYKFPLGSRSQSDTEVAKINNRKYFTPHPYMTNALRSPLESTQGYLDTDSSPSPPKKKRSTSLKRPINKNQRKSISHPYQGDVDTCDSQRSQTPNKIEKPSPNRNSPSSKQSSPNTSVYRSDSFQLLMPPRQAKSVTRLDKIDENSNDVRSGETRYFSLSPISVKVNEEFEFAAGSRNENNSSNISLLSPEISVVEKMSVSKEMLLLNGSDEVPPIDETQAEGMETAGRSTGNNMVADDIGMGFTVIEKNCNAKETAMSVSGSSPSPSTKSASILKGIAQTEGEDQSFSDSLDVRLRDLFLESAKKISQERYNDKENTDNIDIDQIMATVKKARGKRSSTPQKKIRSTEITEVTIKHESVVIEHVQSCSKSKGDRKSHNPTINVIPCSSPPKTDVEEIAATEPAKRGQRKKGVIKVKIQRPRDKGLSKEKRNRSGSRISVCSDSGINESGRTDSDLMISADDSVKLIHNHSVTCLEANECIGDDFQFQHRDDVNSSVKSLQDTFSKTRDVNSSIKSPQDIFSKARVSNNSIKDLLCDDALDASEFISATRKSQGSEEINSPVSSVPSTLSYGSLMTDDLSDESPPEKSKWYLLSEDDTNSVNYPKPPENSASVSFPRSNLKQIFTGYSIPDLSTISEGSREDSTKPN